jgi:hypothetical protein
MSIEIDEEIKRRTPRRTLALVLRMILREERGQRVVPPVGPSVSIRCILPLQSRDCRGVRAAYCTVVASAR